MAYTFLYQTQFCWTIHQIFDWQTIKFLMAYLRLFNQAINFAGLSIKVFFKFLMGKFKFLMAYLRQSFFYQTQFCWTIHQILLQIFDGQTQIFDGISIKVSILLDYLSNLDQIFDVQTQIFAGISKTNLIKLAILMDYPYMVGYPGWRLSWRRSV